MSVESADALVGASMEIGTMLEMLREDLREEIADAVGARLEELRGRAGEIAGAIAGGFDFEAFLSGSFSDAAEASRNLLVEAVGESGRPVILQDEIVEQIVRELASDAIEYIVNSSIDSIEDMTLTLAANHAANSIAAALLGGAMRHGVGLADNLNAAGDVAVAFTRAFDCPDPEGCEVHAPQ